MNEREYDRLRKKAQDEYNEKIKALELVWKMAGGGASRNGAKPRASSSNGLRQAIVEVIGEGGLPETFNQNHVLSALEKIKPDVAARVRRPHLSITLRKLSDEEFLELVEVGKGKRPTSYKVSSCRQQ